MYIRVSLRGMLRLIRVDTLRTVNNVGFLAGRLKCRQYIATRLILALCEDQPLDICDQYII